MIIFSYSKVSAEGKMILEYAKTAGYTTMAFTSRLYAPQEQRARYKSVCIQRRKRRISFHDCSGSHD